MLALHPATSAEVGRGCCLRPFPLSAADGCIGRTRHPPASSAQRIGRRAFLRLRRPMWALSQPY